MKTVYKLEFVKIVSKKAGVPADDAKKVLDAVFESIFEILVRGDRVLLKGFGKFEVHRHQARKRCHPLTGDLWDIPAKNAPYFKPGLEFKAAVNKGGAGMAKDADSAEEG